MEQEYKGHINIKDTLPVKDNIKDIRNVFYVVKKAERLLVAIYKITSFIDVSDPLRSALRLHALCLLEYLLSFTSHHNRHVFLQSAIHEVKKVISLLYVSYNGSYVSEMNFSLVQKEYVWLEEVLLAWGTDDTFLPSLESKEAERTARWLQEKKGEADRLDASLKVHHNDFSVLSSFSSPSALTEERGDKAVAPPEKKPPLYPHRSTASLATGERKETVKKPRIHKGFLDSDKRKEIILSFIAGKGKVSIKDILTLPALSGRYSEKTIQRELLRMVEEGVLKKEGERRWSRYSLP